jgi:hypothetical protein
MHEDYGAADQIHNEFRSVSPKQGTRVGNILPLDVQLPTDEKLQGHTYPFSAAHKHEYRKIKNKEFEIWFKEGFNLQDSVDNIGKPIVEIGGPTLGGHIVLEGIALPAKPRITNITPEPIGMEHAKKVIDELVDGRNMQYEDESLGMIMMNGINVVDHDKFKDMSILGAGEEHAKATEELAQVAEGKLKVEDVKHSVSIKMYRESYRALEKGGLLIVGGAKEEDIKALKSIGFELVGYDKEHPTEEELELGSAPGPHYELVMVKK